MFPSTAAISGILLVLFALFLIGEVISIISGLIEGVVSLLIGLLILYALFSYLDPFSIQAGFEFLRQL